MSFGTFKKEFQKNFAELTANQPRMFEVEVNKDALWNLYLDSFPAGTNEVFRERREFDCSCCRQFVKSIGNAVVIKNNHVKTIWDFKTSVPKFQPVIDALNQYILAHPVTNLYLSEFAKVGTDKNYESTPDSGVLTWEHFYLELPNAFVNKTGRSHGDAIAPYRDTRNVFKRSLEEISEDAILTVRELIASNTLYKGAEWKDAIDKLLVHHRKYAVLNDSEKENYTWAEAGNVGMAIGRIKNHSIGVLLTDITQGVDLETAVRRYENIVAPNNYKRPKAIFTKKMLEEAQKTVTELGYMDSLSRRYATLDDISINNILFSNKDAAKRIKDSNNVFADMMGEVSTKPKKFDRVEEISAEKFFSDVLPGAREVEVYLENKHSSNFVSLIAPKVADSKSMFKWNNGFSWAYTGNITDSDITERVKAAGGRTDGVLRFSHSWNCEGMRNASLMDLHVFMPGSTQNIMRDSAGREIHDNYGNTERVGWNHRNHSGSGGTQDVDYTAPAPVGYIPVENTTFPDMNRLKDGVYTFKIHNWNYRTPTNGGFKAEIAFGGQIYHFVRKEPLKHKEWVTLAKLEKKNGEFKILEMAENYMNSDPIEVWNLKTNQFVPVTVAMYSPNYWDEQSGIGHKHYFFMLKDCVNPETPNGFYNEFLKPELEKHRRVFEALGGRMAVENVDDQLSGIGFSSTKRAELVVKVKGQTERVMKIKF